MNKSHGLWRFHYEARLVLEKHGQRWWIDEEVERVYRLISVRHMGYGTNLMWSKTDAIVVCAKRYMRRFGGIRTVADWNALVDRIATRAGFTHYTTLRAAKLGPEFRDESPIYFHADKDWASRSSRPYVKFSLEQIEDRLRSINRARRMRIEKENERQNRRRMELFGQLYETKQHIAAINKAIKSAQAAMKERA